MKKGNPGQEDGSNPFDRSSSFQTLVDQLILDLAERPWADFIVSLCWCRCWCVSFRFGAVFIASFYNQGRVMEVIERTVFCLLAASLLRETSAVAPLPEEKLNVVSGKRC